MSGLAAHLGPVEPSKSIPTTAALGALVAWQVAVTTAARALVIPWVASTAYVVGDAVTNDSGKMYVCITAGTSAGSGGPTGTTADITDNAAHWRYVAASATAFKGAFILRNLDSSAAALFYSQAAAIGKGGAQLPAGQAEPVFHTGGDATGVFVATASSTARASVAAYL